ncbi:MAG: tripartite tricarboxylate transporter substrate binding protein [Desulfobacteraceae bacterium]|jgi:tripartite-type tricarboxylate transporter receptor subunit TctC
MDKRMNLKNLLIVAIVVSGMLVIGTRAPVMGGDYPSKPIRMIYPFPAGSGGDIATRIFADAASKALGQPVKVSNVTGGRATIGAAKVAQAKKDGYEIGSLPIGPAVTQPIFSAKLPYGTEDLEPICQFTYLPIVLVAGAHTPYKTTKELIAYAKKHPGEVKYAHPGLGTVPFLMLRALETQTGIQMKGVPFKGLRPGITAAVGGHVDIALAVLGAALGLQKAGKLNIMGVFAGERLDLAPNVPTVEEDGVATYPQLWTGIFAPKGLAPAVLKKLESAFAEAAKSPEFGKAMLKAKSPVLYLDRNAFQQKIAADIKYFKAYKAKAK